MNAKEQSSSQWRNALRAYGWQLAAFTYVVLRSLPNISYPIYQDQAAFLALGEGLLRGQQLYRDLWENHKPPGISYIFALIAKLFGHVMWSVGVVDILWLLLISYCIFRFTKRYVGTIAAGIAVAVNASWHCRAGYMNAAQPETFLVLFVLAGYLLVASEGGARMIQQFAAGLCFAAAFWIKYNAVAFLPLLLVVPYVDWRRLDERPFRPRLLIAWRQWLGGLAAWLAGFLVPSAAILASFWLAGSWESFHEAQFEVLPRYVAMSIQHTPSYWAFWMFEIRLSIGAVGLMTIPITALALLLAWKKEQFSRLMPVFLGAAFGFASTAMQLRYHNYMFETFYPFFAMIWGYVAVETYPIARAFVLGFESSCRSAGRVFGFILWTGCVVGVLLAEVSNLANRYEQLNAWRQSPYQFYANYPDQLPKEYLGEQLAVVRDLRASASSADGLFVWGAYPLIYYLSELRPPTRFLSNFPLMAPWGPSEWKGELMNDLGKSPPLYVVVGKNDGAPGATYTEMDSEQYLKQFPQLDRFIADFYRPMPRYRDFVIYRRVIPSEKEPER